MHHRFGRVVILCSIVVALLLAGCSAPIPREDVPAGWALDVHQPGEWWTRPLIPRSVIIQRCPPPRGWASEPDLTRLAALPPGSDIEYSFLVDDYHCSIGWSEPVDSIESHVDMDSEAGLRRICSSSGLPMDASWRYLGRNTTERVGNLPSVEDGSMEREAATAGFRDQYGTVVACLVENWGDAGADATVELSVGANVTDTTTAPADCPVTTRDMAANEDGTVSDYQLRGVGAVRDEDGRVLAGAETLRIGLAADSVTSSHPVVDGIAIVDAWVTPKAAIHLDWDQPPQVEGEVLDADGRVLSTCRT